MYVAAFVQRLRELGWIEGRTVAIEYRWAEGRDERFAEIAAEFVRLKVDVIVTAGSAQSLAAKQATSIIPIVFAIGDDPVGSGLVASLARPGGNVTGLIAPSDRSCRQATRTLARDWSPGSAGWRSWPTPAIPAPCWRWREVQAAARTLGLEVCRIGNPASRGYRARLRGAQGPRAGALCRRDPLMITNRVRINTLALRRAAADDARHSGVRRSGRSDVLWTKLPDLFRRAADYVDKILRGAKPADLPVEQPTKFDLVINLKTAKALGLDRAAGAARPRRRGDRMKRREFITLLGGAAAAWPLAARAQQRRSCRPSDSLGAGTAAVQSQWTAAFVQRLRELGWIEGRNVAIEYRWAEGRSERFAEIAAEFVRLKVDVIVTQDTPPVLAAKQATSTIPIVFAMAGDPVGTGFVASLARPGGNVTGLSSQQPDTAGKRLELLREIVPGLRRLAILADVGNPCRRGRHGRGSGSGPHARPRSCPRSKSGEPEDIDPAFEALKGRAQALYVLTDPLLFANRVRINTLALGARLPTMHGVREYVEAGGLMSYGPNFPHMWRRAADYVDKILRGAKPADIPVEQPTKFDLVINLKTARRSASTIPPTLLARADEVIE